MMRKINFFEEKAARRILAIVLAICMVLATPPVFAAQPRFYDSGAGDTIDSGAGDRMDSGAKSLKATSGSFGTCAWNITDKVLTISAGQLPEIDRNAPWRSELSIDKVVVENGVKTGAKAAELFYDLYNCTEMDLSGLNTSAATDMSRMFYGCSDLTSLDVSGFDTSKVTNMDGMFEDCFSLTSLDVSHFDTSKVTTMINMFRGSGLTSLDLSSWVFKSGVDTTGMLYCCRLGLKTDFYEKRMRTFIYAGGSRIREGSGKACDDGGRIYIYEKNSMREFDNYPNGGTGLEWVEWDIKYSPYEITTEAKGGSIIANAEREEEYKEYFNYTRVLADETARNDYGVYHFNRSYVEALDNVILSSYPDPGYEEKPKSISITTSRGENLELWVAPSGVVGFHMLGSNLSTLSDVTVKAEFVPISAQPPEGEFNGHTMLLYWVANYMQYSLDEGETWHNINDITAVLEEVTTAKGIWVKKLGKSPLSRDSEPQKIIITKPPPPVVKHTDETTQGQNNGVITAVSDAMEYREIGDAQWKEIDGDKITGLAPATYHVRVKGAINTLPSKPATVVINPFITTDVAAIGVKLNKNEMTLPVASAETLIATVTPADATNKDVIWESDKESVATVSSGGEVTAVSIGTALITVTTVDGGNTDTCIVTVIKQGGEVKPENKPSNKPSNRQSNMLSEQPQQQPLEALTGSRGENNPQMGAMPYPVYTSLTISPWLKLN